MTPFFYWTYLITSGGLGVEPAKELNHLIGEVALYYLLLNIFIGITIDFRLKWPNLLRPLLQSRRFLGLVAFVMLIGHVFLYFVMEAFEVQAFEQILTKRYLIFGALAFLILMALAITSFDRMVQKMTIKKWKRLHRMVHLASIFFFVHILSIEKADLIKYGFICATLFILQMIRLVIVWRRKMI